jgi:hypothetical protein
MIDLLNLLNPIVSTIEPGRLIESLIFLVVLLWKLNPHLKKIEDRMEGIENAVREKFVAGESRFEEIETRLDSLETNLSGSENGKSMGQICPN